MAFNAKIREQILVLQKQEKEILREKSYLIMQLQESCDHSDFVIRWATTPEEYVVIYHYQCEVCGFHEVHDNPTRDNPSSANYILKTKKARWKMGTFSRLSDLS